MGCGSMGTGRRYEEDGGRLRTVDGEREGLWDVKTGMRGASMGRGRGRGGVDPCGVEGGRRAYVWK